MMVIMMIMRLMVLLGTWGSAAAQDVLQPDEFRAGMEKGEYDAVIDVRTMEEWKVGHIVNATLIENLASNGTADDLLGCQTCTIAVYCRSGRRAGDAITRLQTVYGFTGTLYNALGVNQWTEAGYPLVTTEDSVTPPCALSTCDSCRSGTECPAEEDTTQNKDSGTFLSTVAPLAIPGILMMVIVTTL